MIDIRIYDDSNHTIYISVFNRDVLIGVHLSDDNNSTANIGVLDDSNSMTNNGVFDYNNH
jgi:hypothetical protein